MTMNNILAGLRAIGESTRLRLLFVLAHGEFNVTELTRILGQSQPRISRHLKLLCEAGLFERHREGSWMLFRLGEHGSGGAMAHMIADLLPADDPVLARDLERLEEVRAERAQAADEYFNRNAADWDRLRSLYVAEDAVEQAILDFLGGRKFASHLDFGTGTGRVLELLGPYVKHGIGIDQNREMLALARSRLERAGLQHCQVRQGDIFHLPYGNESMELVTIHQVLHYLDAPERALSEAARVLTHDGQLVVVDFAPHELEFLREEHQHRRLGLASDTFAEWARRAGLVIEKEKRLPPPVDKTGGLTVSLWLARPAAHAARPRLEMVAGSEAGR